MEHYRKDFPELEQTVNGQPLLYLDSGATALKPNQMIEEISRFYGQEYATVNRGVYSLATRATDRYHAARETVQRFLNASRPEEVVFTRGTTDALNLLAQSLSAQLLSEGDEILISEMEHHANIVPWQMACQRTGARLVVAPITEAGELNREAFKSLLSPRTKIVSLAHISNTLGTINPIKEIANLVHAQDALLIVDGAQSAPDTTVDVQELGVDFFVFSGHKAYGPTGIGVLYGRYDLLKEMPPPYGGGDMIDQVTFERTTYQPPPIRFEAGTPMIAQAIGLAASLDYLTSIGMEQIHAHKSRLHQGLESALRELPRVRILGEAQNKAAITSLNIEGAHPYDVGTFLDLAGIACRTGHHCTQPMMSHFGIPGTVRVSLGLYNTEAEMDRFVCQLKKTIETL